MIRARTVLACLLLLVTQIAAQASWAKVPPLPATCYSKSETFDADIDLVRLELDDAIKRQQEVNNAVLKKLGDVDPATQQARLIAYMKRDPATAQTYLEDIANVAQRQQAGTRVVGRRQALEEKLKALQTQYVADAAPLMPLYKRFQDAMAPGPGNAMHARLPEFAASYDAAYERFCPKWWGAASPFVGYLGEFKNMQTKEAIPFGDEMARAQRIQLEIMGIPATGFKSTAELEGMKEYLMAARKIYQQRPSKPLKELQ